MKKVFSYSSLILTILALFSCNENDPTLNENLNSIKFELTKNIKVHETTSLVSENFLKMGVSKIFVTKEYDAITFKFKTEKMFILNGEVVNFANFNVKFTNEMLFLESDPSLKVSIYNDKPFVLSDSYSGNVETPKLYLNRNFNILIFFLKEIITDSDKKYNSINVLQNNNLNRLQGCSFWNTYYVYSTGSSRSVSASGIADEIEEHAELISGCSPIGEPDTSCLWDNHMCVTTQAFCCN